MNRLFLIGLLPLVGCAMTPDQQDAFRGNFGNALNGLSAAQAARPVYYQPAPIPQSSRTICRQSFGAVVCDTN
jgi:hypothetical protein